MNHLIELNRPTVWSSRLLAAILGIQLFAAIGMSAAQREKLPSELRTNGKSTLAAVEELSDFLKAATVTILDGEEVVALGTKLSTDGWIATKASELGWQTTVRLENGDELIPSQVVVNEANDIAFINLDRPLENVPMGHSPRTLSRGKILVALATPRRRIKMGIVSASRREVERVGGALGVGLGRDGGSIGGVRVLEVFEDTAAEGAGIKQGDVINSVNGMDVLRRDELIKAIAAHNPGESIEIALRRGEKTIALDVVLGFRSTYFRHLDRNQRLSGKTSTRLTGFEEILQHDIPVDVAAMGGALADLAGNVIGINIARSDRVSTFALPIELVHRVFRELSLESSEKGD